MGELLTAIMQAKEKYLPTGKGKEEQEEPVQRIGYGGTFLLPEQEQLGKYAEAFYGLARMFQVMPCQKEWIGDDGLQEIFAQVRELVCGRCGREKRCWGNDYFASCRMLYEMTEEAQRGAVSAQLVREMAQYCGRPEEIADAVEACCLQARQTLLWNNRMMELRTAVGEQIFQTAELMRRTADGFEEVTGFQESAWKKLRRNLNYLKVRIDNVRIFRCRENRTEIFLSLRTVGQACVSAKTVAEVLSECCGRAMRPARDCQAAVSRESSNFHFVPDTKYQLLCGISSMTKAGELVSGDTFAFLQKENGQVVMSLADGMGSGMKAYQESEKVIELLEQFLEAGFPQETAVRMINSCMLLQNQEQMYATIDLCMVDLYHATCDMIKSGSAPTFLKHGAEIEVIQTDSFPAGLLWQSEYESLHRALAPGDVIVMMTDGVLEALPEEDREEQMKQLIEKSSGVNAKEFARKLMERVYLMQQMEAKDDMTVLVGILWEK